MTFLPADWTAHHTGRDASNSGPRKGNPSSNAAIRIVPAVAIWVVHFFSLSASLCDSPKLCDRRRFSKPTHIRLSPPVVFLHVCGTPHVRHNTKKITKPILYRGPPHSSIISSATGVRQVVQRSHHWVLCKPSKLIPRPGTNNTTPTIL